ncbi:efflux RND transporter permease subunit [Afifella sp. YEN Y35]|uniref:efflux RND transporter permease subunit n=1 Tax=Afifella sp. YEN Y35 TaxID=3388337 RepID=UPI0039E1E8FF
MISLLEGILRRPRTVITLMLVSLLAGIAAYQAVPKDANPDIDIPVFYVSVVQQGVSPEDAERLLVRPLEKQLRGLDGLKELTAIASEGHAAVVLEFNVDFDKDRALADIRAKVDQAQADLPSEAEEPLIVETNFALVPTITVAISGNVPERTLVKLAEKLQDEIESISTVLRADINGNREEVLEVVIDMAKLQSYDITQEELLNALSANNQLIPAGFLDTGRGRFSVKVPGLIESAADVYSLPIKQKDEGVVTLGDVATIKRTFKDATNFTRVDGEPAIAINVVKRLGTNVIENNDSVREVVAAATKDWPKSVQIHYLLDQSSFIYEVLGSLQSSIMTAILLVMIVVLATLGLRSALLVGLAIPTSFMIGFLIVGLVGMTVNMMVMFGLVLTVGMLVDGAIIIVEYADRKIEEGMDKQEAYIRAAKLMFWPIVSSTATTLAAFLPMLLWPGVSGEFMSYLPIMVIIVLSASLVTAMIFMPATGGFVAGVADWMAPRAAGLLAITAGLAAAVITLLLVSQPLAAALSGMPQMAVTALGLLFALVLGGVVFWASRGLARRIVRFRRAHSHPSTAAHLSAEADLDPEKVPGFTGAYVRFLHGLTGSLVGNVAVILVMAGLIVSIFVGFARHNQGVEFFVDEEPDVTTVLVSGRGNLSANEALALVSQVEAVVLDLPGVESVVTNAYPNGGGGGESLDGVSDKPEDLIGELNLELLDFSERRPWQEMEAELRRRTASIPGIKVEPRRIEGGPPTGKDINLQITAPNYDQVLATTRQVRAEFDQFPGLLDVEDDTPLPGIEWELTIDREEAGRFNAGIASVGSMIQLVTNGVLIGKYRPDDADDELDIRVRLPEDQRSLDRLDQLRLRTTNGQVPIANFVTREAKPKVSSITRKDGLYAMSVKAAVDKTDGATVDGKVGEIQAWLDKQSWPDGVHFRFRGADEDQAEAEAFLGKAFAASLFLMALILITQFNSFWQTGITLLTIILAAAGALIGMVITGQKLSVIMTGTGIMALAGIVVNNAIVLIDTYNRMRSEGVEPQEAILKTAAQRLRPILLTTITTIAGLIPMATQVNFDFFNRIVAVGSITSVWWVQLSTAVISGLAFSTVLTLILVPVLLALPINLARLFKRNEAEATRSPAAQEELPLAPARPRRKRKPGDTGSYSLPDAAE